MCRIHILHFELFIKCNLKLFLISNNIFIFRLHISATHGFTLPCIMILDDIIYISLLCISVALGPIIRNVPNLFYRQLFSTLAGFVIVFIVSGTHIFHPIFVTLVNALILQFWKRYLCRLV